MPTSQKIWVSFFLPLLVHHSSRSCESVYQWWYHLASQALQWWYSFCSFRSSKHALSWPLLPSQSRTSTWYESYETTGITISMMGKLCLFVQIGQIWWLVPHPKNNKKVISALHNPCFQVTATIERESTVHSHLFQPVKCCGNAITIINQNFAVLGLSPYYIQRIYSIGCLSASAITRFTQLTKI